MRTLEELIEEAIKAEAKKLTLRFQAYHNRKERIHQQNLNRIANPPQKVLTTPPYWSDSKTFNPFYVHKHAKAIARSVTKKIRDGTYSPRKPYLYDVPKLGGGTRSV